MRKLGLGLGLAGEIWGLGWIGTFGVGVGVDWKQLGLGLRLGLGLAEDILC